jgi:hypothetical protein
MRKVFSSLLMLLAALFVFLGVSVPVMLRSQAADDRVY